MADNPPQKKTKDNLELPRHILLLLGYFLLAIILTWPTFLHLTTHLPGDGGDDPALAWNLWWVKYALLNTGQNPFQTDFMFYPLGINLAFYTLTVLNAITALPLTLNFGVVTASNLHLFFTFAAGGYGAFLLARYVLATADRRVRSLPLGPPTPNPQPWIPITPRPSPFWPTFTTTSPTCCARCRRRPLWRWGVWVWLRPCAGSWTMS